MVNQKRGGAVPRPIIGPIPVHSAIPVTRRQFEKKHTERQQTDIVLTLTPHIVRVLDMTDADLATFKVARDTSASGGAEGIQLINQTLDVIKTDEPVKPKLGLPPSPLIIK